MQAGVVTLTPGPGLRSSGKALALSEGQVIHARVAGVAEGELVLGWRGASLRARSDLRVQPGQVLRLQVDSVRPEQVTLRVIELPPRGTPAASLGPLLTSLGFAGGEALLAAHYLLLRQQPLRVRELRNFLAHLKAAPASPGEAEALTRAWAWLGPEHTLEEARLLLQYLQGQGSSQERELGRHLFEARQPAVPGQDVVRHQPFELASLKGQFYLVERRLHQAGYLGQGTVVFIMELEGQGLGGLWFRFALKPSPARELDALICAQKPEALEPRLPELKKALGGLGFKFSSWQVHAAKVVTFLDLLDGRPLPPPPPGLDRRV